MFLARKIARAKWGATKGLATGEIPADAVTADLRTQENTLSFWRCPTDTATDIEGAVLAIAAAWERLDKLDIVWLADQELQSDGQTLIDTAGRTPVTDMVAMHVDVSQLDYVRLGRMAHSVVAAIEADRFRRLPKARVKRLIREAVGKGRIDRSALHETLRAEVTS